MKTKLTIELRGVEFVNKGAELMLFAIMEQIKNQFPDALFVMEQTPRAPRSKHLENGIYTKTNVKLFKVNLKYLFGIIPTSLLRKNKYIPESGIDVVIDGSGFAFGDQWGAKKAGDRSANHIVAWKSSGKKVILLPQAFGPFTKPDLVKKMEIILDNADLVFARDPISYDYLKAIKPNAANVILRPDFTNLIKGVVPAGFNKIENEVAIIPNSKMIETASAEDGAAYISLLKKTVPLIQAAGYKPFFLIHESKMDIGIANQINESLANKIPVVQEDDSLKVKGIIGSCKAVITSRFHGLVSCLCQSIPVIATGWSHKYEMLLKDYNFPEGLIGVNASEEELKTKLTLILDEEKVQALKASLAQESVKQKELTKLMWETVFDKIKS